MQVIYASNLNLTSGVLDKCKEGAARMPIVMHVALRGCQVMNEISGNLGQENQWSPQQDILQHQNAQSIEKGHCSWI